jgi:hypothetical protein
MWTAVGCVLGREKAAMLWLCETYSQWPGEGDIVLGGWMHAGGPNEKFSWPLGCRSTHNSEILLEYFLTLP